MKHPHAYWSKYTDYLLITQSASVFFWLGASFATLRLLAEGAPLAASRSAFAITPHRRSKSSVFTIPPLA